MRWYYKLPILLNSLFRRDKAELDLKTIPVRFTVPLNALAPGEYTCQVTVLNPLDKKATFWRSAVMLVP